MTDSRGSDGSIAGVNREANVTGDTSQNRRKALGNGVHSASADIEAKLRLQVEKWREKLLDLGNRNPLINCSFNPSRGVIEIIHPECETVWRKLAAESEAGAASMRFPWRRDLVPPSTEREKEDPVGKVENGSRFLLEHSAASELTIAKNDSEALGDTDKRGIENRQKDWNPPLEECLASRRLRETDLLTTVGDKVIDRRLRTLDGYAKLSLSEQGVHCLYMAFGFLKWYESADSDKELLSPLLLVPVTLSRASTDAPWELTEAEDDVIDNLCLRQRLKQDFGLDLPALPDIDELEAPGTRLAFLAAVSNAIRESERWEVMDRCALGRFAFPKVAMWKDLGDHADSVISHALCRSIAGDMSVLPQQAFGSTDSLPVAANLDDEIPPGEIKAILDCDSSQLEAIVAARRGVSFVLDGPPGTGKSQTIANIIADALAEGRRVLFVSEKVSALEVVKRRLDDRGLGDFCLECHSSKANRKAVLEELQWCLEIPVEVYDDATPKLKEAKRKRDALNSYVRTVHHPRAPLGLTPYEVYGHTTRLSRLDCVHHSRCSLPDSSNVDRETFDGWLQLLGRASEVAGVIVRYDSHPWRTCKLMSTSLSLADDLRHHLDVLISAFATVEASTRLLIEEALLPAEITPKCLFETTRLIEFSTQSPEILRSWFAAPVAVAEAVLARHAAQRSADGRAPAVADYIDEIVERFPTDAVARLIAAEPSSWINRFRVPLPATIRGQREDLTVYVKKLRKIAICSEETDAALAALINELSIPITIDLPISSVPKLARVAKIVAASYPMRHAWFDSENWGRIRQLCETADTKFSLIESIVSRLEPRVPTPRIELLSRTVDDVESLEIDWATVRSVIPEGSSSESDAVAELANGVADAVEKVFHAALTLFDGLGLSTDVQLSLGTSQELTRAIERVAEAGMIHGAWTSSETRRRVQEGCTEAIADLDESAEIHKMLQDRLSHRAFKPSSAGIAARSIRFRSWWARLFGGFAAFRREAADLYKHDPPSAAVLLNDCEALHRYHRRNRDVYELAKELEVALPDGHNAVYVSDWRLVHDAVSAFEELIHAVPDMPRAPLPVFVRFDRSTIIPHNRQLAAKVTRLHSVLEGTPFAAYFKEHVVSRESADQIRAIATAARNCRRTWVQATTVYETPPSSLRELVEDVQNATRYVQTRAELATMCDQEQEVMPRGAVATDKSAWERLRSGVDAAERLSGMVRTTDTIGDVVCVEGQLDPISLTATADAAHLAFRRLDAAFQELGEAIELSPPHEPIVEPGRRPPAILQRIAEHAAEQLHQREQDLAQVIDVIWPDADAPVERLSRDSAEIDGLRTAIRERREAESTLGALGVELSPELTSEEYEAASWLSARCAEGAISPLVQAVASDKEQRARITRVSQELSLALTNYEQSWRFLESVLDLDTADSSRTTISTSTVGCLVTHLCEIREQVDSLDEWLKFSRWRRDMRDAGFGPIVDELLARSYEVHQVVDIVSARFYKNLFDHLADSDRSLGEFDFEQHEQVRERFRQLDEWEIKAAATRIRQYQLGRSDRPRPGWTAPATSELGQLQRETQKKRRHKPLRKLFAEIPGVLQRLKPCIMMSPLSVSTFLQSDEIQFDVVIFDEASQVFPWDAIGAIYRGSQLIVAGDEKQLSPTNFFNRGDIEADDDDEDDIGDFESILSLCKSIGMPNKRLRWHYRSRREPLIAFSNRHFYNGDLVTFPSVRDASNDSVRLEFVPHGRWVDRKNIAEAERIVDLAIDHHRNYPKPSLGIIAFNGSQQRMIEDAIYNRRRTDREVDALFDVGQGEPMFIKNLENVQGDERDVILLSMGYAYNDAGKFLKNFGPLAQAGGGRRLNVAVTRAREQIVFVASVRAADMDLSGSKSEGSHLLKAYLEYAERGVDTLSKHVTSLAGECESPFEEEVASALVRHGLDPVAQVGCGGFRIDLALKHPDRPGEFCLGIECDGATYHSSHTARDRDRIRQAVLEGLGWQIVRIWSTDWVRSPSRQLERILSTYELAASSKSPAVTAHDSRATDLEPDLDLQPRIINPREMAVKTYGKIEDVPDARIRDAATGIITRAGATDWDDLVRLVARELGFARTGSKIRVRLEMTLHGELSAGSLRRVGDRVTLAAVSAP